MLSNHRVATFACQNKELHRPVSPSPHLRWTSLIFSTDLQIPLQLQSKDATQTFPAWAFHSQSREAWKGQKGGAAVLDGKFKSLQLPENKPGGVPQHMFLSSMCSTSRPINHEPSVTSSFAYWCRMCLAFVIVTNQHHPAFEPNNSYMREPLTGLLRCTRQGL